MASSFKLVKLTGLSMATVIACISIFHMPLLGLLFLNQGGLLMHTGWPHPSIGHNVALERLGIPDLIVMQTEEGRCSSQKNRISPQPSCRGLKIDLV